MDDVEAIGLLQDPLRRRLYEFVAAQEHEVSRAEAADAIGSTRTLVAFHLDRLVEAGLLEATSRRVNGRTGPGAGRPARLYRRARVERSVSLPPRDHRTAAELLADAAETVRLDDEVYASARRRGQAIARDTIGGAGPDSLRGMADVLATRGYEPHIADDVIRMRNCPFHPLAETHPGLICGMNLALLEGLVEGTGRFVVELDPRPADGCCTVMRLR